MIFQHKEAARAVGRADAELSLLTVLREHEVALPDNIEVRPPRFLFCMQIFELSNRKIQNTSKVTKY